MAVTTTLKQQANKALRAVNLKIDSLTAERHEASRIQELYQRGQFDTPVYPLLSGFADLNISDLSNAYEAYHGEVEDLMSGCGDRPDGYNPANDFYRSPDAEILYLLVRLRKPKRIVEIGSGNSTRIIRRAIADGGLSPKHIAIDPEPRSKIADMVDRMILSRFEDIGTEDIVGELGPGDMLFIDSSHEVRVANDVARLFCVTIPALPKGVAVHIHDVFLPFDYPEPFCFDYSGWGEQYLLQVLLQGGGHKVIWPGYYVQRLRPEEHERLPFLSSCGRAQSFWFETGR